MKHFVLLGLLILLAGCVQQTAEPEVMQELCDDSEYERETFQQILLDEFGLQAQEYEVVHAQCSFGRAKSINTTLQIQGQQYQVWYQTDSPSSSGNGHGHAACIRAPEQTGVFSQARETQCLQLTEKYDANIPLCESGESYDNTSQARQECQGYEQNQDREVIFSVDYTSNRCESFVEEGPVLC